MHGLIHSQVQGHMIKEYLILDILLTVIKLLNLNCLIILIIILSIIILAMENIYSKLKYLKRFVCLLSITLCVLSLSSTSLNSPPN